MNTQDVIDTLSYVASNPVLLEVGRKAVEDTLVDLRDERLSLLFRNNGLIIKERDGSKSDIIRMGPEDAIRVGMLAIVEHIKKGATVGVEK